MSMRLRIVYAYELSFAWNKSANVALPSALSR